MASAYDYRLLNIVLNFCPDPRLFFNGGFGTYMGSFALLEKLGDSAKKCEHLYPSDDKDHDKDKDEDNDNGQDKDKNEYKNYPFIDWWK